MEKTFRKIVDELRPSPHESPGLREKKYPNNPLLQYHSIILCAYLALAARSPPPPVRRVCARARPRMCSLVTCIFYTPAPLPPPDGFCFVLFIFRFLFCLLRVCVCVCARLCVYIRIYTCVCVCVCVYIVQFNISHHRRGRLR